MPDRTDGDYSVAALVPDPNGIRVLASTTLTVDAVGTVQQSAKHTPWPWLIGAIVLLILLSVGLLGLLQARKVRAKIWLPEDVRAQLHEPSEPEVHLLTVESVGPPTLRLNARLHLGMAECSLEEDIK